MNEGEPRVLIVEDDGDIRSLFEAALEMRGFRVTTAPDGHHALDQLRSGAPLPWVIIADLHMPGMDGWKLLTELSQDPLLADIPVVILTAADDPSRSAPRPPVILIKPVPMDTLAATVSAAARRPA